MRDPLGSAKAARHERPEQTAAASAAPPCGGEGERSKSDVPVLARFDELQGGSEAHAGEALYSKCLVRWPNVSPNVSFIDFGDRKALGNMLDDWNDDTAFLQECVREARGYVVKDKEAVLLSRPPQHHVEWWCEASKQWRRTQDARPGEKWSRTHVQMLRTSSSAAPSQSDASASPPDLCAVMRQSPCRVLLG